MLATSYAQCHNTLQNIKQQASVIILPKRIGGGVATLRIKYSMKRKNNQLEQLTPCGGATWKE